MYDNLGRIQAITRASSAPSESRTYGSDLRLATQVYSFPDTSKNVTYSYTYNLAGQPLTMTPSNSLYSDKSSPTAASYVTDGQNRYTSVAGHALSYDGRSNLTNDGTNSFGFDSINRTTTVNSTTFIYDGLNRLYQGTQGSTTNRLLYSGQQTIAEYNSAGTLTNRYVPDLGLDNIVMWWPGASTALNGASWLVTNAFGSVVAASYSGTAATTTYDAFGVTGAAGLSPYNGNLGFKGMASSGASGIYYARARTYNANIGRFLQSDPAGFVDGLNLYAFVHNSPVSGADPQGLDDGYCYDDGEGNFYCTPVTSPRPSPDDNNADLGSNIPSDSSPGNGPSAPRGQASTPAKQAQKQTPKVGCGSALPDGSTVGSRVNTVSNNINNSAQLIPTPYGVSMQIGNGSSPLTVISNVYSGTNFRATFGGPGANYVFLGDAGNFAYGAVSANIGVPLSATELAAGVYALLTHPLSDAVGPFGMDPSATTQVPAGYRAQCTN